MYVTLDLKYDSFLELYQSIEEFVIKSADTANKSKLNISRSIINIIIGFVYVNIIKFPKNNLFEGHIFSSYFLENVCNLLFGREVLHHSHITGKIASYAHDFCGQKVRENKSHISVIAYNLFVFDFFFL